MEWGCKIETTSFSMLMKVGQWPAFTSQVDSYFLDSVAGVDLPLRGIFPFFFWDAWGSTTDLPQSCGTPNGCHKASPKSQLDGLYKPSPVMVGVWQGLLHYHER